MTAVDVPAVSVPAPRRRDGLLSGRGIRLGGLVAGLAVLLVLAGLSLALGSRSIPGHDTASALFDYDPHDVDQTVVRSLRVPHRDRAPRRNRLGLAGAVMQGMSRNPLVDPGILGVNAGAILAVLVACSTSA